MKNFKIFIIIAIALVVIFFVITSSLFQEAQGQGAPPGKGQPPQPVMVVNEPLNPVPIQGDVEVKNTLDVNVTNTPNVNVANTEPVPVRVTNELAFQPWREQFSLDLAEGETSRLVYFPEIPAGKRLIIESVTAQLLVLKTQVPYIQLIIHGVGYYVALSNIGSYSEGQYVWMATHDLKLYAESEDSPYVRILRAGGTNGVFFAALSISGYLVDLP